MLSMTKTGRNRFTKVAFLIILTTGFMSASCSRFAKYGDQSIPQFLSPVVKADFNQVIDHLKSFSELESLRATRVSIQFTDAGSSEKYRRADATLVLKRPENIRLIIQIPLARTKLAEMVSDSEKFKVAIYYDKYKQFLEGTNNVDYSEWKKRLDGKKESQSAFLNARPFHFADALLIQPLKIGQAGIVYTLEEELLEEPDVRQGAVKGARVVRSFYVVTEAKAGDSNASRVTRRFWFDRTEQLHLKRQQIFDSAGHLMTDVRYSGYMKIAGESEILRPTVIEVRRPYDKYSAELNLLPESVEINVSDLPAAAFVLENTEKLPVTNLDARENK